MNAGFGKLWGFGSAEDVANIMATLASPSEYARPLRESWFARSEILRSMSLQPIASHRCTATA